MRYINSNSFQFLDPDQIDEANVVEHLSSEAKRFDQIKTGRETWYCAWAPNNCYFAWSSGHRMVHLVPWDNSTLRSHEVPHGEEVNERKYHVIDCAESVKALAIGSELSEPEKSGRSYLRGRIDTTLVLATGHASGKIKLWDCITGNLIIELLDHRTKVSCLDFTKDGILQLLSSSQDGTLKLWDLNNDGNMYHTFKVQGIKFYGCSFSPNGKWIAAVGSSRIVLLWKMSSIKEAPERLVGHHNEVVSCCFSPDSALLATAAYDTKIILWDMDSLKQMRVLGHLHPSPTPIFAGGANDHYVRSVSFSPNSSVIGSVCDDGYVRMWNLSHHGDPASIAEVEDVISCRFSSGGGVLATGCRNGDVYFLSSPVRVASLKNLCRLTIRKCVNSIDANHLPLPSQVIRFLQYSDYMNV